MTIDDTGDQVCVVLNFNLKLNIKKKIPKANKDLASTFSLNPAEDTS